MNIKKLLKDAPIPLLEAEILLSHILQKDRAYLPTWLDKILDDSLITKYQQLIMRREQGEPIAYILGEKEFWSLPFKVTPDVLIPRVETEILIESILNKYHHATYLKILDLGTGSGVIAIVLAKEFPNSEVMATDISEQVLMVAKENANRSATEEAKKLKLNNIQFIQSNWFSNLTEHNLFDVIVSNPPYIAQHDPHLQIGDCRFEPIQALTDFSDGLAAFRHIISHSRTFLKKRGRLFLEHGYEQAKAVRELMLKNNFSDIETIKDLAGHERITICQFEKKIF